MFHPPLRAALLSATATLALLLAPVGARRSGGAEVLGLDEEVLGGDREAALAQGLAEDELELHVGALALANATRHLSLSGVEPLSILGAVGSAVGILGAITGFNSWVARQVRIVELFGVVDEAGQKLLDLLRLQIQLCEQLPDLQRSECSVHFDGMSGTVEKLQENAVALKVSASGEGTDKIPWYKKTGRWLWRAFRRSALTDDVEQRLRDVLSGFGDLNTRLIALQGIHQQKQLQGLATAMDAMRKDLLKASQKVETHLGGKLESLTSSMETHFAEMRGIMAPLFESSIQGKWRNWAGSLHLAADPEGKCATFLGNGDRSGDLKGWLEGDLNSNVARLNEKLGLSVYQNIDDVAKKIRILVQGKTFEASEALETHLRVYSEHCNPRWPGKVELMGMQFSAYPGDGCEDPDYQLDEHQLLAVLPMLKTYTELKSRECGANGDSECDLTLQLNPCVAVRRMLGVGAHMSAASRGTKGDSQVEVSAATALVADQLVRLRTLEKRFMDGQTKELRDLQDVAEALSDPASHPDKPAKSYEETNEACAALAMCHSNAPSGSHGTCKWKEVGRAGAQKWEMVCECRDFWAGKTCKDRVPVRNCEATRNNTCTAHPIAWYQDDCSVHGAGFEYDSWEYCGGVGGGHYMCKKKWTCRPKTVDESHQECCDRDM